MCTPNKHDNVDLFSKPDHGFSVPTASSQDITEALFSYSKALLVIFLPLCGHQMLMTVSYPLCYKL